MPTHAPPVSTHTPVPTHDSHVPTHDPPVPTHDPFVSTHALPVSTPAASVPTSAHPPPALHSWISLPAPMLLFPLRGPGATLRPPGGPRLPGRRNNLTRVNQCPMANQ